LLDIVAKSIYKDKEVFLRELISNCSDALEKQRYAEISGNAKASSSAEGLHISVELNEKDRTITIMDSGVGMAREEIAANLGTIAKSGSKEFKEALDTESADSIIGQFGVGFYSAFIVSDHVEVYSKADSEPQAVRWVSDGSGEYELSTVSNVGFERGTKIIIKLRPDSREFGREAEVEKILKKHSQFINFPIKLNGELLNKL